MPLQNAKNGYAKEKNYIIASKNDYDKRKFGSEQEFYTKYIKINYPKKIKKVVKSS